MSDEQRVRELNFLLSAEAVRERCQRLMHLAASDDLQHFRFDRTRLQDIATYVIDVMEENYPDGHIPFHSRWRHFAAGKVDRVTDFSRQMESSSTEEQLRRHFELVIMSVLLDAGAGAKWRYCEKGVNAAFGRSEGLAVATFHMYRDGLFSKDPKDPLRVDASRLEDLTEADLARGFQADDNNPLTGLAGRLAMLRRMGRALQKGPYFTDGRLGTFADYLVQEESQRQIMAPRLLHHLLLALGDIWLHSPHFHGMPLGDTWVYGPWRDKPPFEQFVPFHKLSQWLSYSLLEPLLKLGFNIGGLDGLTGLPEYRNGGLFMDFGALVLKDPRAKEKGHAPSSDLVIEWRALTVCLLDELAAVVRGQLRKSSVELPLVKLLQGGTWTAGRKIAAKLRPSDQGPPLLIESDGTVF